MGPQEMETTWKPITKLFSHFSASASLLTEVTLPLVLGLGQFGARSEGLSLANGVCLNTSGVYTSKLISASSLDQMS